MMLFSKDHGNQSGTPKGPTPIMMQKTPFTENHYSLFEKARRNLGADSVILAQIKGELMRTKELSLHDNKHKPKI